MDRASDSGSEGWGFESLPVYHDAGSQLLRPSFRIFTRKNGKSTTKQLEKVWRKLCFLKLSQQLVTASRFFVKSSRLIVD